MKTQKDSVRPQITALYARVTRPESLEGHSIENQTKRFHELAEQNSWTPTVVFAEPEGADGKLGPEDRPEFSKLLAAIDAGEICRVVMRHQDRVGRGPIGSAVCEELHQLGIEVWDFGGPMRLRSAADRLGNRVEAIVSLFEVERVAERVRESRRGNAHRGIHIGPPPFGYTSQLRLKKKLIGEGLNPEEALREAQKAVSPVPGIEADEKEAEIVREVYRLYIEERLGTRQIANELNDRGMLRRGAHWHPQYVVKLLRDPKLAGWTTYDEEAYAAGKPSSAPVYKQARYPGLHPPIVTEAEYEKAQRLLDYRKAGFDVARATARTYPLTGVLQDMYGHPMKGRSSRKGDSRWVYYTCRVRARHGNNPDCGGCDAPSLPASQAEARTRELLSKMLSSPDTVVKCWEAAVKKLDDEAPERRHALEKLDKQIRGLEKEREVVFSGLRNVELDGEQFRTIADRGQELNQRIKELEVSKEETKKMVVALKSRKLSRANVKQFLHGLSARLSDKPEACRGLLLLLHVHHGLLVTAQDAHNLRIELHLDPISMAVGDNDDVADLPVKIPVVLEGKAGEPRLSNEEWAAQENEKGYPCGCGCGQNIMIRPDMRAKSVGIPQFIQGHSPMPTAVHVQELNAKGYVTSTQAAKALGIGATTLRRAEAKGWITPEYKTWGNRHPMRVYRREDIPKLRESMKEAGFKFPKDRSTMTSTEMAKALGISVSYLYYLERRGKVPSPPRDHAGKRMWAKKDVRKLRRRLSR